MNKENEFKQPRSASPEGEVLNIIEKIEGTAEEKRAEKNWLGNLKDKFDKIFKGEKELPPIAVDIFYAPHATAEDIKGLEEHFRRADIYIPENMAWSRADLVEMNKIAQGKIDPVLFSEMTRIEPDDRFSFEKKQMQLIYKSGKPIAFIDIPRGHPLERRFFKLKTGGIDISGSFNAMLENFKTATLEMGRIQKKREEYMLSQLKPAVREILKKTRRTTSKRRNQRPCLFRFFSHRFLPRACKERRKRIQKVPGNAVYIFFSR